MLDTRDIIILTAAFYLGGVVGEFFKSLSEDILTPLLAPAASAGDRAVARKNSITQNKSAKAKR